MAANRRAGVIRSAKAGAIALVIGVVGASACMHAAPLVSRPSDGSRSLVLRNVRVFDAPNARLLEGLRDVVVQNGRIEAVGPPGLAASGIFELDGRGETLLPGLVDVHTHTSAASDPPWVVSLPDVDANLAAFLYAGVTTVLDLGGMSPAIFHERERVAKGELLGPQIYAAGPIFTVPGGHPAEVLRDALPFYLRWYVVPRATREVSSPDEARRAVADLLPDRPDVIKLALDAGGDGNIPRLDRNMIAVITEAGHRAGVRSIAHIGNSAEAIDAVKGGVDALAHSPWREDISDEAVAAIKAAHVPVVITLAVWDVAGTPRTSRADFLPIELEVAGPKLIAAFLEPPPPLDEMTASFMRAATAAHDARRRNVAKLRAAGIPILAGSDACNPFDLPGAGLHLELKKLVEAGLTPAEALRTATWDNARFLAGESADFGEIAVGKRADFVLVAGDPVSRISDLGMITQVILGGTVLERRAPQ